MHNLTLLIIALITLTMPLAVYGHIDMITENTDCCVITPTLLHLKYIFVGSCIIPTLICGTWARALRSSSMALLAVYYLLASLSILADGGTSIVSIFTANTHYLKFESLVLSVLSIVILTSFTAKLFKLQKHLTFYSLLLHRLSLFLLATIPISYFLLYAYINLLIPMTTIISLLILLYISTRLTRKYSPLSTIYSITILIQLSIASVGLMLYVYGISTQVTNALDMFGFWLMALMVTYMMGRRYYGHLQDEKKVQQKILASAKAQEAAQQELLNIQQHGHELLERKVQERTFELNIALQELEAANKELQTKNTLDELSGLYNRRYYDQKIQAEFRRSRRNLTPFSIVLVDVDHFKNVNDSYGHLFGDKCIVEIANLIKSILNRGSDVGCRYGGEEFCLILPETDSKGAIAIAQAVCESVNQQKIIFNNIVVKLSVSCGVATYQQEENVIPEMIFACADKALYKAKKSGRNQVQVCQLSDYQADDNNSIESSEHDRN